MIAAAYIRPLGPIMYYVAGKPVKTIDDDLSVI